MSNFCILRAEKLKTFQNVAASIAHHLRTRETPNADLDRIEQNYYYPNKYENQNDKRHIENNDPAIREAMKRKALVDFKSKLPDKVRKNAVLAVELLMTLSPEAAQKPDFNAEKFCDCATNWAHQNFGKDNIYFIAYHLDEKTPHVSVQLVPKDDKGKLNCRHYLGGRGKLRALQDSFAEEMGKYFGLERGVKGSKAQHQKVKRFYNAINRQQEAEKDIVTHLQEDVPEMTLYERAFAPDKYRERVEQKVNQTLQDTADNYSAQLAEAKRLRAAEENMEREHRYIQAALARDRRLLEEEYQKRLDEKRKELKEHYDNRLQDQKDKWAKEKTELEAVNAAVQKERDRAQNKAGFFLAQSADWYKKTGLAMAQRGCKNFSEYDAAVKAEKKERQAILDKGFGNVGWELTERGTIELFTRETYGKNRATKPFFELTEKDWIDALTRGQHPKVREQFYVNYLKKEADGSFHIAGNHREDNERGMGIK